MVQNNSKDTNELEQMKRMFDSLRDDAPPFPLWTMGQLRAYVEQERQLARIDELESFVAELDEQDPFIPLDGTPRDYVYGKFYSRTHELRTKITKSGGK
jgi:hypothetical protein